MPMPISVTALLAGSLAASRASCTCVSRRSVKNVTPRSGRVRLREVLTTWPDVTSTTPTRIFVPPTSMPTANCCAIAAVSFLPRPHAGSVAPGARSAHDVQHCGFPAVYHARQDVGAAPAIRALLPVGKRGGAPDGTGRGRCATHPSRLCENRNWRTAGAEGKEMPCVEGGARPVRCVSLDQPQQVGLRTWPCRRLASAVGWQFAGRHGEDLEQIVPPVGIGEIGGSIYHRHSQQIEVAMQLGRTVTERAVKDHVG